MADYSIILQDQRDRGGWIPADVLDVRSVIDEWQKTGLPFPPALARLDLVYWMDRDDVKPYRYYAKRWGWGPKKAYNLLVSMGLIGAGQREQEGSNEGARREQVGSRIPADRQEFEESGSSEGAAGEQEGSSEGAVYPDSDSDTEKRGSAHAHELDEPEGDGEDADAPEEGATRPPPTDPFDPQQHQPSSDEVRGAAGQMGVPAEEAVSIANHFASRGWVDRNGIMIRNWALAIKSAYEFNRKSSRRHGRSNQQAPSGKSRDPEEQFAKYQRRVAEAEEREQRRAARNGSDEAEASIDPE